MILPRNSLKSITTKNNQNNLKSEKSIDNRINAVCPGFVATDFNGHRGTGTAQEGGIRIAKYAMIGAEGPTGKFISEEYNPETGETPW